MSEPVTRVVFRKWKDDGQVIALMPDEPFSTPYDVTSYQHIGQHGSADYRVCVSATRPATPEEYAPLLRELEQIGYNVRPIARFTRPRNRSRAWLRQMAATGMEEV
jgi:hypothetical protein